MNEQITEKEYSNVFSFIEYFSKENNIIPILTVESGSRMWGFASTDSDFDIRGFHITSLDEELSIHDIPEQYEKMEELMDIVSYDINKYFKLLSNSNPNLLEQLQSNIVYKEKFEKLGLDFEEFKKRVFENVNLYTLFKHYISMAEKNYTKYKDTKFTYKKILYVLRSLFCAKYIYEKNEVPPVILEELINKQVVDENHKELIYKIIKKKSKSEEKEKIENPQEVTKIIDELFEQVKSYEITNSGDEKYLKQYLNDFLLKIKYNAYNL